MVHPLELVTAAMCGRGVALVSVAYEDKDGKFTRGESAFVGDPDEEAAKRLAVTCARSSMLLVCGTREETDRWLRGIGRGDFPVNQSPDAADEHRRFN